jgi:hypothetical protein
MIELVKAACSKAATTLCVELFRKFLDAKIMSVLGIVIRSIGCVFVILVVEENATRNFLPHLDKINAAFCVGKKIKGGVIIVGFLDSR